MPFDVGAALEKERPGQGSYDIRDFQGRRVNFELLPLEGSNPHAVKVCVLGPAAAWREVLGRAATNVGARRVWFPMCAT